LPEGEAEGLEVAYLSDQGLFTTLCSIENELLHTYLRGALSGSRLQRFEAEYLGNVARRRRLDAEREWFEAAKLTRANGWRGVPGSILRSARGLFRAGGPALKFSLVSVPVLVLLVFGWLVLRTANLEVEVRSLRADAAAGGAAPRPLLSFVLTPGLTRDAGAPQRLAIPADASQVKFELRLFSAPRYPAYRATLLTADGVEAWGGNADPAGDAVIVVVPAGALARADYKLRLEGIGGHGAATTIAGFAFGVVRR
jgi:hypothetical protein